MDLSKILSDKNNPNVRSVKTTVVEKFEQHFRFRKLQKLNSKNFVGYRFIRTIVAWIIMDNDLSKARPELGRDLSHFLGVRFTISLSSAKPTHSARYKASNSTYGIQKNRFESLTN